MNEGYFSKAQIVDLVGINHFELKMHLRKYPTPRILSHGAYYRKVIKDYLDSLDSPTTSVELRKIFGDKCRRYLEDHPNLIYVRPNRRKEKSPVNKEFLDREEKMRKKIALFKLKNDAL